MATDQNKCLAAGPSSRSKCQLSAFSLFQKPRSSDRLHAHTNKHSVAGSLAILGFPNVRIREYKRRSEMQQNAAPQCRLL
jgi:hypothetical protein